MITYYFKRFMWMLGYRHVLYRPSIYGYLHGPDFWKWEYGPKTERRDYTEKSWMP